MTSAFWNDRYRSDAYAYGQEPNDFVREEANRIPPGPVLCLAEGEGRNAVFLAGQGHTVTAVDFSSEALRKAERLAHARGVNIKTVHADLASYAPDAKYAAIIAVFAHLPPPIRGRVHAWIPSALEPDGVFILEAYTPRQLALKTGGPGNAALLMDLASLTRELAPLTIVVGREVEREIHEGEFHSGLGATVQIVARHA